jgi:queuine/archaeosine tRNA-ribosyltransferase
MRESDTTPGKETMAQSRTFDLSIAQTVVPLPCFFPSVSSVKTNLMPVDYVELLDAAAHPLFLASAYDIANCPPAHRSRMDAALGRGKARGTVILMDSGNYEGFWKDEPSWTPGRFHEIARTSVHHLCFCHDNQKPPESAEAIAEDVIASVLRDQAHALGTVAPIIHGPTELLAPAARRVAAQLFPVVLAVPERALGDGIIARTRTVRRIREALDGLGFYCPLHLLGTGNPLSMAVYAAAGADSFDGLEWCQTVVDHETGRLFHFQQWDLFREQTSWGENGKLPYIQSALMHNLQFYRRFMEELRKALMNESVEKFLSRYASEKQVSLLLKASKGGD